METKRQQIIIYEHNNKSIKLNADITHQTIWASLNDISDLFGIDKSGISRHIKNIFDTNELEKKSTVANFATVQKEGDREIKRSIEYYNLDMILSIGYRVNSKNATLFRQWSNKVLKQYILNGYAVNKKLIEKNYKLFQNAVSDIKKLVPKQTNQDITNGILDIVNTFASTWLSLDAYDKSKLPQKGKTIKKIDVTADELINAITILKEKLVKDETASNLFAQEREIGNIQGIVRSIYQGFNNIDLYNSIEEKAANLLYLVVKNHPFVDGNKRVGAFSFLWFLRRANILNTLKINPETLTTLTILIAESKTSDKDRIIGIILELLSN